MMACQPVGERGALHTRGPGVREGAGRLVVVVVVGCNRRHVLL